MRNLAVVSDTAEPPPPAPKLEPVHPAAPAASPLAPPAAAPRASARSRALELLGTAAARVLPPLVTVVLLLTIWEVASSRAGATLPAPSKVVNDTWTLISQPFFNNGGNDVGMAWQLLMR